MKKLFLAFAACLMALSVSAAELNIYASGLKAGTLSDDKKLTIEYVLNAPATALEFQVLNESGVAVKTIALTEATLLTKGAHTGVEIDLSDVGAGTYKWAIEASAAATGAVTAVVAGETNMYQYYHARGVEVNMFPETDYFGYIYVSEAMTKSNSQRSDQGIYIYSPLLDNPYNQSTGNTGAFDGGVDWKYTNATQGGPRRMAIGEDGYLYISANNATNSGVWRMDPANPSANFVEILAQSKHGETFTTVDALDVKGSGENLVLYTLDGVNYNATTYKGEGNLYAYAIGTQIAYTGAPTIPFNMTNSFLNKLATIREDGRGGFWFYQNRDASSSAASAGFKHFNSAGTIDFSGSTVLTGSIGTNRGALALNADKTLLAIGANKKVYVYSVIYNESGKPTLTEQYQINVNTTNIDGISFDWANNVYVVSAGSEKFYAYATPKADNSCDTPAPSKYGFEIEAEAGAVLATSISIPEGTEKTVEKGESFQLTAVVEPADHTSAVVWTSDDADVATVVNGLVTAVGPGEAIIRASIDAQVAEFKLTVKKPVVTIAGDAAITLARGETLQLVATLTPADATATIVWSSSDASNVTVSETGLLTAVSAGPATITAKTADSEAATVQVTVPTVPLAASTYKVGGPEADYESLYDACFDVNENGILGDITIEICADLTEPKNIGLVNTSEHTITIRPDGNTLRTITFTQATANVYQEGSLVIGLEDPITQTHATAPTNHITIDGTALSGTESCLKFVHKNNGGHLTVYGAATDIVINNILQSCEVTGGSKIEIELCNDGTNRPTGVIISNNHITGKNATRGIAVFGAVETVIEGNTFDFKEMGAATLAYGIHGYQIPTTATVNIRNNKFIAVETALEANQGVAAINAQGGGKWIIENNYFAGMNVKLNGKKGRIQYIRESTGGTLIRHNTFYIPAFTGTPSNGFTDACIGCIELNYGSNIIENNLFVSEEPTAIHTFVRGSLTASTIKNCVYHHISGDAAIIHTKFDGSSPQAWSTYRTKDATAKWAEVEFTNAAAGDLSLTGSSNGDVRFAVPRIAAVTTDIEGKPRHANTAYAGAWEGGDFRGLIVDNNTDLSDLAYSGVDLSANDIIVTNKATLTCDIDETAANVRVEDGAKLVVDNATLAITGTFTAHSQNDVQPQILTKGTGAITYGTFQFLKRIPADRYYFFSLPFECATSSVTVDDGVAAKYNIDWNIRYYDGAGFAANPSNKSFWLVDNTGKIQPNQGYTIGVATAQPGQYRELAFTTSTAVDFSLATSKTIAVAANGATGTEGEKYKGWSFIMNPYTSNINGTNDNLVISSNAVAYVTIPDPGQNKTYTSKRFSSAGDLPPFFGFFVQVAEAGKVVFTPGTPAPKEAPARRANGTEIIAEPLFVGVRLSNGIKADETSLVIGEQFTEAYEIGSDLMKMIGYADKPQLYTFDAETKYAFHSLNETAATAIHPLGVYLPAESEYTFSLMPIEGEREVQAVYLYDYETNACVDLMQEDYTFTSGTLNSEKRFALSPMLAPKATTAIDTNTAVDLTVWQSGALQVCVEGAAAGDRVRIFDIQGRLVSEWIATETSSVGNVPASGMYVVECTGATGVQVVKLMINH